MMGKWSLMAAMLGKVAPLWVHMRSPPGATKTASDQVAGGGVVAGTHKLVPGSAKSASAYRPLYTAIGAHPGFGAAAATVTVTGCGGGTRWPAPSDGGIEMVTVPPAGTQTVVVLLTMIPASTPVATATVSLSTTAMVAPPMNQIAAGATAATGADDGFFQTRMGRCGRCDSGTSNLISLAAVAGERSRGRHAQCWTVTAGGAVAPIVLVGRIYV
jgi:hypothetical protein